DQQRLGGGEVTAAGDDLLALARHCAAKQSDLGSDSLDVGGKSPQAHRHSGGGGLVPIQPCGAAQVVDHQVQISVAVQIRQRDGVVNPRLVCPPLVGDIVELQAASIAKGDDGRLQP